MGIFCNQIERQLLWNEGKEKPNIYCLFTGCSKPSMAYHGNRTNMVRHLHMLHPKENATYLGCGALEISSSLLASFMKKKMLALTDQRVKKITSLITNIIVKDLRLVNIINGACFVDLIADGYPDYLLASTHYNTDRVKDMYAIESTKLIDFLFTDANSLGITTDLWTSVAHHAYLGITAHFVTREEF